MKTSKEMVENALEKMKVDKNKTFIKCIIEEIDEWQKEFLRISKPAKETLNNNFRYIELKSCREFLNTIRNLENKQWII
jgi:hypothetical protein